MSNIKIINNKISQVKKFLKYAERYQKHSIQKIEEDIDIKLAVERSLFLVVQATIDLAETFIAYKNFRKPTTMSENFDILQEENIIPISLTEKLVNMVGFRNIITHGYEKINYATVYDILQNRLQDIIEFIKIIEKLK